MSGMGVNEELSRMSTRRHQKRTEQQLATDAGVQAAILAEMQRLNQQVAWQNQALAQLLQQRAQHTP